MKDFLGHELRVNDKVVTFVLTDTGGTEFVIAQIERLTRHRVCLHNWETKESCLHKAYTLPEKCIRVENA